ncbi:MAG: hypothetical protein LBE12_16165 [Planctomycetaceae bacterium]|nr:hypothetical protein [Planctomycetaceae bacterium]
MKRNIELCTGDDTQITMLINKYCNSETQIKRGIASINLAYLSGYDSLPFWQYPFTTPYQSYQSEFYVNLLALKHKKEAIEPLRQKIRDYLKILKFKRDNFEIDFGDDLINAPVPLRTYLWALLYLGGIENHQWLTKEIDNIFEDQITLETQRVLDFSSIIIWNTRDNDILDKTLFIKTTCFDESWGNRFLAEIQFNNTNSEQLLINTLERIIYNEKFDLSFREKWKINSASMLLYHVTNNPKYKKFFPSAYGNISLYYTYPKKIVQ